jgi:hypothetical protein
MIGSTFGTGCLLRRYSVFNPTGYANSPTSEWRLTPRSIRRGPLVARRFSACCFASATASRRLHFARSDRIVCRGNRRAAPLVALGTGRGGDGGEREESLARLKLGYQVVGKMNT